jgi:hypothetical protein
LIGGFCAVTILQHLGRSNAGIETQRRAADFVTYAKTLAAARGDLKAAWIRADKEGLAANIVESFKAAQSGIRGQFCAVATTGRIV